MGNAIYRDLIQARVMVQVDHLVLAVSNVYKYRSGGKAASSTDYRNTCNVADTLYSQTRRAMDGLCEEHDRRSHRGALFHAGTCPT